MGDDFGMQKMSELCVGPFKFNTTPKDDGDGDLDDMDGAETPVPGSSGRTYRHQEIARERDKQAPYGQVLGGYSGSGQRACLPAKED